MKRATVVCNMAPSFIGLQRMRRFWPSRRQPLPWDYFRVAHPQSVRVRQHSPLQAAPGESTSVIRRNRRGSQLSLSDSLSMGGEFLPCQFSAEILFLLGNALFVATRIDERVRASLFHERVLFLESEVAAMGTEENIAWQRLQNAPHALVVFGDLRVSLVVDELVARVHVGAAEHNHVVGLAAIRNLHRPRGTAFGMPWSEMRNEYRVTKFHFVTIVQYAVHFGRPIQR